MTGRTSIGEVFSKVALSLALLVGATACVADDLDSSLGEGESDLEAEDATLEADQDKARRTLRYQAEKRTHQSGYYFRNDHRNYSGDGFMISAGRGSWMGWNYVNAPVDGTYDLRFRYANANPYSRESWVFVDGRRVATLGFMPTGSTSWSVWKDTISFSVKLSRGRHSVWVQATTNNGGPNLDYMLVTEPDSSAPAPGFAPPFPRVSHVATSTAYDSNGQGMSIARPSGTRTGDLLVLALHRTDDFLPIEIRDWTRVAECYKTGNESSCATANDCTQRYGSFCTSFGSKGGGQDLAQAIFMRRVNDNEPSSYQFNLNPDSSGHPGWAVLTALRGASTSIPVRDWANVGCDRDTDSRFSSVYAQAGDMVLLSQSFDDTVPQYLFGAPSGMSTYGYVSQSDEAGFMFGKVWTSNGETGTMETVGNGASTCKDGLISLSIRPGQ